MQLYFSFGCFWAVYVKKSTLDGYERNAKQKKIL